MQGQTRPGLSLSTREGQRDLDLVDARAVLRREFVDAELPRAARRGETDGDVVGAACPAPRRGRDEVLGERLPGRVEKLVLEGRRERVRGPADADRGRDRREGNRRLED